MPVAVESRRGLILVQFSGEVCPPDLLEASARLDAIDRRSPGLSRLVDATAVRSIDIGFPTVAGFAAARARRSLAGTVRTAILADAPSVFGFARMFQNLFNHPDVTVEVFRQREDAVSWLLGHSNECRPAV